MGEEKKKEEAVSRRKYLGAVGGLAAAAVVGWGVAGYLASKPAAPGVIKTITETKTVTATPAVTTPVTPEGWYKPDMYPVPDPKMMPSEVTIIQHDFLLKDEYFTLWNQLYGRWTKVKFLYTATGGDVIPKLAAGPGHGIDLFHQDTVYWLPSIEAGVAAPLDINKIPNYKYLFDYFKKPDSPLWYNGKCYGVPFFIWKDTLTYDTYQIDVPPEEATLDLLFNPEVNKKYGKKIGMPADHESVLAAALYLDIPDPCNMSDEELKKVEKVLMDQRPYVKVYWESMSDLKTLFLTKEVNRAWSWEPVVKMVNTEGEGKFNLVFPATKSPTGGKGCLGGFEGFGLSVDADEKHEYAAYLMMNFVIGDDYFYRVFKALNYRTTSKAVLERMTPEEVKDRGLDDPIGFLNSMVMWAAVPRMDKYTEVINRVKAG